MSEQAEYFLQDVLETEHLRDTYAQGFMSDQRAYEEGLIDEMGWQENPYGN